MSPAAEPRRRSHPHLRESRSLAQARILAGTSTSQREPLSQPRASGASPTLEDASPAFEGTFCSVRGTGCGFSEFARREQSVRPPFSQVEGNERSAFSIKRKDMHDHPAAIRKTRNPCRNSVKMLPSRNPPSHRFPPTTRKPKNKPTAHDHPQTPPNPAHPRSRPTQAQARAKRQSMASCTHTQTRTYSATSPNRPDGLGT